MLQRHARLAPNTQQQPTLNNRVRVYNRRRNDWITIIYKCINKYIAGAISWAAGQQAAAAAAGQACAQSEAVQVRQGAEAVQVL